MTGAQNIHEGVSRDAVRVTLAGVGTVGRDFTRLAATRADIDIVAACSRNPRYVGKDLGALAGMTAGLPEVVHTLDEALAVPSDVLLVATASHLADVGADLRDGIEAGRHVLTTAEEAAFPWANDARLADELDAMSRAAGMTVLGTGVNPGFTYDALVLTMSGACWDARHVNVERIVDISGYSDAILRRSGVGFSRADFERRCATGEITGHIGFPQSMTLVADRLGHRLDRIERSIEPLLARRELRVGDLVIAPGETAGFIQHYVGIVRDEPWFTSHLVAHIDMDDAGLATRDTIEITGAVPVRMVVEPAFNSQATVAAVLANSLHRLMAAPAGWVTVAELPPAIPAVPARAATDNAT